MGFGKENKAFQSSVSMLPVKDLSKFLFSILLFPFPLLSTKYDKRILHIMLIQDVSIQVM